MTYLYKDGDGQRRKLNSNPYKVLRSEGVVELREVTGKNGKYYTVAISGEPYYHSISATYADTWFDTAVRNQK